MARGTAEKLGASDRCAHTSGGEGARSSPPLFCLPEYAMFLQESKTLESSSRMAILSPWLPV